MAATRSRGKEMTTMSNQNEAKAILRSARIPPQKARLVADQVRGLSAERAVNLLKFSAKKAAHLIMTVVESAIAKDRKSTRLNSSHYCASRMPSSALTQ